MFDNEVEDEPDEGGGPVRVHLTALQRQSVEKVGTLLPAVRGKLWRCDTGRRPVVLTAAEFDDLDRQIAAALPRARTPHRQRLAAVQAQLARLRGPTPVPAPASPAADSVDVDETAADGHAEDHLPNSIEDTTAEERPEKPDAPLRGRVFQFRVELVGVDPPVWRRFWTEDCDLGTFHHYLRGVMGWTADTEPHRLTVGGVAYGQRVHGGLVVDLPLADEAGLYLGDVFPAGAAGLTAEYEYDTSVGWRHAVVLEGHPAWAFDVDYPVCLAGAGACPPEGAGGAERYQRFLRGEGDLPPHCLADHARAYGPFDPAAFELAAVNARLEHVLTFYFRR